jgi:hypothetical protein
VKSSAFTAGQRRVLMLMIILVIAVFAALAGFIVTSLQDQQSPPPVTDVPSILNEPTVAPATVTPSPTPIPTMEQLAEGITSRVQAARLLDQIERQVETVRGLSPRAEVPLNFLNEDEMSSLLRRLYRQRDSEALLLPFITLGLLPDETISIGVGQTAGAYILAEAQLYVVTNPSEINADDRVLILARAYDQALQDQHFDLEAAEALARSTDAKLAVAALEGGDEMLLMALYRYGDLVAADWTHLEALALTELPSYGEALDDSQAWVRLRSFPYREGRYFATILFEVEGWDTVNRAYADLPRSTEQVLHPERYLAEEPDTPSDVFVPDLSGVLGEGWTLGVRDTLGEFVTGVYLEQTLTEQMAWQAADGWGGDTFVAWEHEDGGCVRIWRTIWDNTSEAAEFERALVTLVPQRYLPTRPLEPPQGLPGSWWETDSGVVYVYRVARHVVFADGPDADTLAGVVEALP